MKNIKTILIALVLTTVTLSVNATNFSVTKNIKKADAEKNQGIEMTDLFDVFEAEISVESWMTHLKSWKSSPINVNAIDETSNEENLVLEDWMLNFNTAKNDEQDLDEEIEVENWMLKF